MNSYIIIIIIFLKSFLPVPFIECSFVSKLFKLIYNLVSDCCSDCLSEDEDADDDEETDNVGPVFNDNDETDDCWFFGRSVVEDEEFNLALNLFKAL